MPCGEVPNAYMVSDITELWSHHTTEYFKLLDASSTKHLGVYTNMVTTEYEPKKIKQRSSEVYETSKGFNLLWLGNHTVTCKYYVWTMVRWAE